MIRYPTSTSAINALTMIALLRIVDSKTLNHFFRSSVPRAKFVQKNIDLGRIQKVRVVETNKHGSRKTQLYYQIGRAGIIYLADQGVELYEAALNRNDLVLFSNKDIHNYARTRAANITTGIVMAYAAGADIPAESFGSVREEDLDQSIKEDESENENETASKLYSLKDFYRDFILDEDDIKNLAFNSKSDPKAEDYMIFHARGHVKEILASESSSGNIRDFNSGRYAGILDSNQKSLMIFVTPRFTMSWSNWIVKADMNAYRMWGRTNSVTPITQQTENGTTAVLIVNNAREFAYHYNTSKGKRADEIFGGSFTSMYIVPNDYTGAKFLNWLAKTNDDDMIESMVRFAVSSGEYVKVDSRSAAPFHLHHKKGFDACLCLTLDAKLINKIDYYAKDNPESTYQVLCLDWQKDFLQRVLPSNVIYRTFPMSLIGF